LSDKKETKEPQKKPLAISKTKTPALAKQNQKSTTLAPITPADLWEGFNDVFERFRKDFQTLVLPSSQALEKALDAIPQTRTPVVDLQDRGKDFLLKAEMPGFKKEDIEIQAYDDSVEISGTAGWKYDKKTEKYVCKERACHSFYRAIQLPEDIKVEDIEADLKDGVLEIILTKKSPKQSKKITLK
jgi:HSP20 family protein